MCLVIKAQSTSGYKGAFIGGAALTGLNVPNWAGKKTFIATPFYQLNTGFSFQTKRSIFIDIIPLAVSYNSNQFSVNSGILVRYYLSAK